MHEYYIIIFSHCLQAFLALLLCLWPFAKCSMLTAYIIRL